jgi:ABC-type lipoprotein release transport system permease subunit
MNVIFKISLRNLVRQKRRNLLLGSGIMIGVCLLVIANALSAGITDMIFNGMVATFSGHIFVTRAERDKYQYSIIRDQERMKNLIMGTLGNDVQVIGEDLSADGRTLGNGKASYLTVIGIQANSAFRSMNAVSSGDLEDLTNPEIEHPFVLYETMAKRLNVQINDIVQMRFETVYNQVQTVRFTLVTILKAQSPFYNQMGFADVTTLKQLLGYQPHETRALKIVLNQVSNPNRIFAQAERLHQALQPGVAGYRGIVSGNGQDQEVNIFAVSRNPEAMQQFQTHVQLVAGSFAPTLADEQAVLLSQPLAQALKLSVGDKLTTFYQTRFQGVSLAHTYRLGGIFAVNDMLQAEMLFLHPQQMYKTVFPTPPQYPVSVERTAPLFSLLVKEWTLLERTTDADDLQKKRRMLTLQGWQGATVDVQTIHEIMEDALLIQNAMQIVTVNGVVILFFIIQIGVVNTLRMTVRERTREIGTVRAIGMQGADVRWCFVCEIILMALLASLAGIVIGLLLIHGMGQIPIDSGGTALGFLLINDHLYFVPRLDHIAISVAIVLGLALLTAYFPSQRAARLSVVEALRHYE